ncbi:hypothetical protein AAE478_002531 [Parahypoxylon ruwenzoriense]
MPSSFRKLNRPKWPADLILLASSNDVASGPNTSSSVYSCTDLSQGHPSRWLKASEVRHQVEQAPSEAPQLSSGRRGYPKNFCNNENFPQLQSREPRVEFPVLPGTGVYTQEKMGGQGRPGPSRTIFNTRDRQSFDVAYHDRKAIPDDSKNMKIPKYRPSRRQGHGQVREPEKPTERGEDSDELEE